MACHRLVSCLLNSTRRRNRSNPGCLHGIFTGETDTKPFPRLADVDYESSSPNRRQSHRLVTLSVSGRHRWVRWRRVGGHTRQCRGPAGHHGGRFEHRRPAHRSGRRRVPEGQPGNRVTVGTSGTGGGFQKFCRDETDISDASRPIRPAEKDACAKAGVAIHRDSGRVRRSGRGRASQEHLGDLDDGRRAEDALGARRAGQDDALESDSSGLAGPGNPLVRRRRRFRHLRLFHRGDHRKDGRQPRRLHVERRRQRHRAGRERRRERARAISATPTTNRTRASSS